jgi:MFS family permease
MCCCSPHDVIIILTFCPQGGFTMDRFGRKRTIQIGAAIATVGGVLQCSAANLPMILVGRIVAGWAVGLMSMSVPVYQAECAHPNIRGMIVGLTQQMIGGYTNSPRNIRN